MREIIVNQCLYASESNEKVLSIGSKAYAKNYQNKNIAFGAGPRAIRYTCEYFAEQHNMNYDDQKNHFKSSTLPVISWDLKEKFTSECLGNWGARPAFRDTTQKLNNQLLNQKHWKRAQQKLRCRRADHINNIKEEINRRLNQYNAKDKEILKTIKDNLNIVSNPLLICDALPLEQALFPELGIQNSSKNQHPELLSLDQLVETYKTYKNGKECVKNLKNTYKKHASISFRTSSIFGRDNNLKSYDEVIQNLRERAKNNRASCKTLQTHNINLRPN